MNPISWATSYFITKHLKPFIPSIDSEHIKMSLWAGSLELRDLDIKIPWTNSPKSVLSTSSAFIQHVEIRIPWQKLLKGNPCIINIELSGVSFEFEVHSTRYTPQDIQNYKATLLHELDISIRDLKKHLETQAAMNSEGRGLLENIISSLRIQATELKVSFRDSTHQLKSAGFSGNKDQDMRNVKYSIDIERIELLPCNCEFVPLEENLPEEHVEVGSSILTTIQTYFSKKEKMIELLPEIQFKQLNIQNLTFSITYENEDSSRVLLNSLDISSSISLRNLRFFSVSLSNSSISISARLSSIKLSTSNQELKTLTSFLTSLPSLSKKTSNINKSNWKQILHKTIKLLNKRSLYRIYRELIWKKVYKELYYKHVQDLSNDKFLYSRDAYSIEELYREAYERNMNTLIRLALKELMFYYNKDMQRTDLACKQIYEEKIKGSYMRSYYSCENVELALIKEIEKLISYKYIIKIRQKLKQKLQLNQYKNVQGSSQSGVTAKYEESCENKACMSVDYAVDIAGLNVAFKTDSSIFVENTDSDVIPKIKRSIHQNSTISKPLIFLESTHIALSGIYSTSLFPFCSRSDFSRHSNSIHIEDITLYNMHIHDLNNSLFKKLIQIKQPISISYSYIFTPQDLSKPALNISIKLIDIDISINQACISILYKYIYSILNLPSVSKYTQESQFLDLITLPKLSFRRTSDYTGIIGMEIRRVTVLLCEKYVSNVDGIMIEVSKIKVDMEWDDIKEKMNSEVRMKYLAIVAGKASHWNPENAVFENSPLLESYNLNLDVNQMNANQFEVTLRGRIIDVQLASASLLSLKKILDQWLNDPIKLPPKSETYSILRINSVTPASITARELKRLSIHINFDGICIQSDVKNSLISVYIKTIDIQIIQKCFESCIVFQFSEMSILDRLASKPSENILLHVYTSKDHKISPIASSDYLSKESISIIPGKAGIIIFKSYCKESFEYRNILNEFEIGLSEVYLTIEPELMHIWLSVIYEFMHMFKKNRSFSPEESGHEIKQKCLLHIQQGSLCFDHKNASIYLLSFRSLLSCTDIYSSKLHVRLQARDLHFTDLTQVSSNYSVIISPSNNENSFDLNYTDFTEKLLQIRFKNININYLNRVLNEIKELFCNHYPNILSQPYHIDEIGLRTASSFEGSVDDTSGDILQFQILALNCTVKIPRNSASKEEMLMLNIEKLVLGYEMNGMFFVDQKFDWEREIETQSSGCKDIPCSYINSQKYVEDLQEFAAIEIKNRNLTLLKKLARKIQQRLNKTEVELEEFESVVYNGFDVYYARFDLDLSENTLSTDVESFKIIHENQNVIRNLSCATDSQLSLESTFQLNPFTKQKSHMTISSVDNQPKELIIQLTNLSISDTFKSITDTEEKLNFEIYIIQNDPNFKSSKVDPMTIKVYFPDRVFLELFEDQFNLLIKTLSENFCENYISVLPLHSSHNNTELIDINIEILFKDILEISTFKYKLYENTNLNEFKDAPWRLNKLRSKKGLCDIEIKDFTCKVHIYSNGRKDIYLLGNSLSLIDCRYYSHLINLGKVNWFYSADSDMEINESFEHTGRMSQVEVSIKLESDGDKSYEITLCDSVLLIVPDLISEVNKWFLAPFDMNVYPNPSYCIYKPSRSTPSLKVSLLLKNSKLCVFESFEDPHRNNCFVHVESADLVVNWMDDCREGPGRIDVSFKLDIESVYFLDTLGQRAHKNKTDQCIMRSFKLQLDYSKV